MALSALALLPAVCAVAEVRFFRLQSRGEFLEGTLDRISLESHQRAARATEEGRFASQIVPVPVTVDGVDELMTVDEGIRWDTSLEKLG